MTPLEEEGVNGECNGEANGDSNGEANGDFNGLPLKALNGKKCTEAVNGC